MATPKKRPLLSFSPAGFTALALIAFLAPPAAPAGADEIFTYGDSRLAHATLPNGPASAAAPAAHSISQILVLPSGKMLATTQSSSNPPSITVLNELLPNGSLRRIGEVAGPAGDFDFDEPLDLALDHRGRVYLLTYSWTFAGDPPLRSVRLVEIDPETAATLSSRPLPDVYGLAPAPDGFWANTLEGFRKLDPDSLQIGPPVVNLDHFGSVGDFDVDSAGKIYFIFQFVCSPPCIMLGVADPFAGTAVEAPRVLNEQNPLMHSLTIRRDCSESATTRCLQQGRFRTEVAWEDFAHATGQGKVAEARSADTGVFWFFDRANWELMAKVLDGCALNGHYWVFGAASTDVAYTLKVTDTETGAFKTYSNRLGQLSPAIADTDAFACSLP